MGNRITPNKDGSLEVAVDPHYILTLPASLPDASGEPKLTGYSISMMLGMMAQQIVGARAPQLYPQTVRPKTSVEVRFDKGQFLIKFTKMEEVQNECNE